MKLSMIEIGTIVNTHGVRGEMKLQPRDVEAELLLDVTALHVEGKVLKPATKRIHKGCLLFTVPEVTDLNAALAYKGKKVSAKREELPLPEGMYLPAEILGMTVLDAAQGTELGKVKDVIAYPAHDVYVVKGEKEFMVPAVPAFIDSIDLDSDTMKIHVWEGLL